MEKVKILKLYSIQILFLVLVIPLLLIFSKTETERAGNIQCEEMCTGWSILSEDGIVESYEKLPKYVKTKGDNEIVLQRTLGKIGPDYDTIGFFAFQQQIYVYLDGEEILRFAPEEGAKSKTPGNGWKLIELQPEDEGKTFSIRVVQCYSKNRVMIPALYMGTAEGIMSDYLKGSLPAVWFSVFGAAIGIIFLIVCAMSGKNQMLGEGIPWLGLFALFRGICSAIEGNTYSFFFDNLLIFSQISYMCLKMCVVPLIMFDNKMFHNGKSKVLNTLAIISAAEFWISCILQFTGLVDFADTIIVTRIIMLVLGGYVTVNGVKDLLAERQDKMRSSEHRLTYIMHCVFIIAIIVTSFMDMYGYYFNNNPDAARYSRLSYIGYVLVVVMALLLDFMKLVFIGRQAEDIREEASMDAMTKLWNRASFEKDIDKPSPKKAKKMGIIMFDLNNLKLFNDSYGHDMGDYYIKVCSEVIRDSFSKWGNVYRIGGDEFCGIAENLSVQEFEKVKEEMELQIRQLRIPNYELHMEIASGFCIFDEGLDKTLRDTMKRADINMYERKQQMKMEDLDRVEGKR